MKISLFAILVILFIVFFSKKVFLTLKRTLFKDQSAWSGKDINIQYSKDKDDSKISKAENYLKVIADESKIFLEEQSYKEDQ